MNLIELWPGLFSEAFAVGFRECITCIYIWFFQAVFSRVVGHVFFLQSFFFKTCF